MKAKKIISLSLIPLIFTTQIQAYSLKDHYTGVTTSPSNDYQSATTKARYTSSGSISFNFKNRGNYTPWWQVSDVSGPMIQADCRGVAIKEMYASLLDLNEIKSQLEEGGSQIAWGVMLALVSSLPVISDVFMKLQKWARMIQSLLQDMCAVGQSIVNNTEFGQSVKGVIKDWTVPDDDTLKFFHLDGIAGDIEKLDDTFEEIDCNFRFSADAAAHKKCMSKVAASAGPSVQEATRKTGGGLFNDILINETDLADNETTNRLYIDRYSAFINSGKISGFQAIPASKMELMKPALMMGRIFFPTTTLSGSSIKNNITDITNLTTITTGSYYVDLDKLKSFAKKTVGNNADMLQRGIVSLTPIIPIANVGDALINGFKETSSSTDGICFDGYCNLPNNYVMFTDFAASIDSGAATVPGVDKVGSSFKLFAIFQVTDGTSIKVEWEGALVESYKTIKKLVYDKNGISGSFGTFGMNTIDSDSITATGNISVVVPGMNKYIDVISLLEKKAGMETAYSASLKELLAKYNAYLFSKAFLKNIVSQYDSLIKRGDTSETLNSNKQAVEELLNSGLKDFEKILQETNNFKTVIEIFEKIELNMKKETQSNMI